MALPKTSQQQDDDRVIHHELGHWLMAREMGFTAGKIFLKRIGGKASGHAKVYPRASTRLSTAEAVDDYLTKRIMVLFAGVIVEVEWYRKTFVKDLDEDDIDHIYENGVIDHSGLNDKGKVEELLVVLAGIRNGPAAKYPDLSYQTRVIFVELYNQAINLVGRFLDKLYTLAELVKEEQWQSNGILDVPNERLVELEDVAAERVTEKPPAK